MHRVFDLIDRMLVRAFQEQGAGLRVLDLVDEGVVLLAQIDLVEQPGVAEAVRLEVVEAVHRGAAARQGDALHVPALGPSTRPDALLGEHVQGEGVDALLVDDDERLALLAHAALELDDLRGATGFGGGSASSLRRRRHRRGGKPRCGRGRPCYQRWAGGRAGQSRRRWRRRRRRREEEE